MKGIRRGRRINACQDARWYFSIARTIIKVMMVI